MFRFEVSNDTSTKWCEKLFLLVGIWPPLIYKGWKLVLYYCYTAVFFSLVLGTYIIIQLVDLYMVRGNIQLMTADAFLLFTNLVQVLKIFNIMWKRKLIMGISKDIEDLVKIQTHSRDIDMIKSYGIYVVREFIFYLSFTYFVVALWVISAIMNKAEDGSRVLPLSGWYPYDKKQTPAYEMTFAHQVIALFIASGLNVVKDCMTGGLINQVTCQFALLRLSLENITEDLKTQYSWSVVQQNHENDAESEEVLYKKLKTCVTQHQIILSAVDRIEECFSFVILVQFTVSLIIICVTAFQMMMQGEKGIVQIFGIGTYLLDMIYQVFMYCSHGNELIIQSNEIMVSAYFSSWYDCSPRFKQALRTLMIRSVRPVMLTAGGFAILSYETFTGILKASYSFFTVLQQVDDKI